MPSRNLSPEGQRRKLFNQRLPTLEKKVNELVQVCRAEVALFILPHDDDEMWVFRSRLNFPSVNRAATIDLHTPADWVRTRQRQARTVNTSDQEAIANILPSAMDLDNSDDVVDHSDIDIEHTERPPAVKAAIDTAKRQPLAEQPKALAFGQGTAQGEVTLPFEGPKQPAALVQNLAKALSPPEKPTRPSALQLSDIHRMSANKSPSLFVSPTTPVRRRPRSSSRRRNGGLMRPRKHNV